MVTFQGVFYGATPKKGGSGAGFRLWEGLAETAKHVLCGASTQKEFLLDGF